MWEWMRDGSEVADLNLSIGNFIRNSFGLWSGNDELMWSCTKEARRKILHEDEASAIIIARLALELEKSHKLRRYEEVKKAPYGGSESLKEVVMKPFLDSVIRRFAVPILLLPISLILITTALPNDLMTARVVSVTDGDNLTVIESDNKQVLIRLHGLDCPEGKQAYGKRAKQFTSSQRFGTTIRYREVDIDRYSRTVATVYLEDGTELNLAIPKAGLAWHYKRYSKRQDYTVAEEESRRAGIGLWQEPNAIPPWEWRRNKRRK